MATSKTKTKAQVNAEIRDFGITRINTEDMVKIAGGTFVLETPSGRFVEIKVTAKNEEFTQDSVDALLQERELIERGKQERADASAKKKARDVERRAKASEKASEEKGE